MGADRDPWSLAMDAWIGRMYLRVVSLSVYFGSLSHFLWLSHTFVLLVFHLVDLLSIYSFLLHLAMVFTKPGGL